MSSSGFGQSPNKETVYSGPAPTTTQGNSYGGFSPASSYNGAPANATVYRPAVAQPEGAAPQALVHGHKAANLFFWIAGLSLVNTVLALTNAPFAMALGLGVTRLFDFVAKNGNAAMGATIISLAVIGVFALIGVFARKGSRGAILTGMILYAADTATLFLFTPLQVISLIVHGLFLFSLFGAYRASRS